MTEYDPTQKTEINPTQTHRDAENPGLRLPVGPHWTPRVHEAAIARGGQTAMNAGTHCSQPIGVPEMDAINRVTEKVIGAAIEVHRCLGPGLQEQTYADALAIEMTDVGLRYRREVHLPVQYKGHPLGYYRIDFVIEECVIAEVKSVEHVAPVFEAQVITYLAVSGLRIGLLINFNSRLLRDGIKRLIR